MNQLEIERVSGNSRRTCDRPCEPRAAAAASRKLRSRICRLKRVAADFKDDVKHRMPRPSAKNGKRIAIVGGGPPRSPSPATSRRSVYHCTVFDSIPRRRHDATQFLNSGCRIR